VFNKEELTMVSFKIMLHSITDVKDFVNAASKSIYDIDLVSGRYVVDAKSIMGIFSLDLTKPITVNIHGNDEELVKELERFKVE